MNHSISGVHSAFLRERGIPAETNTDDACQCNGFFHAGRVTESRLPKEQWSAAAGDLKVAVTVPFCEVFYLSIDGFDHTLHRANIFGYYPA